MIKQTSKRLVLSAFFLALGLVLPFLTGQIQSIGQALLPMHIPVLLCGFVCGWQYGLAVGFITPLFRSLLFGMPPMFPIAVAMSLELATYGLLCGLMYKLLPKKVFSVYLSLITSMIGGRIVCGIATYFLMSINKTAFTWKMFTAGAFFNALPGIIIQIIIIPAIVLALQMALLKNKNE